MRQLIIATVVLIIAASSQAQSSAASEADSTTPALTKSVAISPTDSPLVRAAKLAVASRQHPSNRRVLTLSATAGRGRFAQATGPTEGPYVPPAEPKAEVRVDEVAQEKAKQAAAVQKRLKDLEQEEQRVGAEMDEPYGGDIEEDAVDSRLTQISTERQQLQQPQPAPPPPH